VIFKESTIETQDDESHAKVLEKLDNTNFLLISQNTGIFNLNSSYLYNQLGVLIQNSNAIKNKIAQIIIKFQ
jgi:hypothetical protein